MFRRVLPLAICVTVIWAANRPALSGENVKALQSSFAAIADSAVADDESANVNYANSTNLGVLSGGDNLKETYLKFEVKGIAKPVRRAILKVHVLGITKGNPSVPLEIWSANNDWQEESLTWNHRPAPKEKIASFDTIPVIKQSMQADVTRYVSGEGTYTFRIAQTEKAHIVLASKEAGEDLAPSLLITHGEGEMDEAAASKPIEATKTATAHTADDLYLDSAATYPDAQTLILNGGDNRKEAYLAFNLPGMNGDVNTAKLKLYCTGQTSAKATVSLYCTANGWTETDLTLANRPQALPEQPLAEAELPAEGGWIEFDVKNGISGTGRYSFLLRTNAASDIAINSSKAESNVPVLEVNHQDGLNRTIAEVAKSAKGILSRYGDRTLASYGILDVTKAPYHADNTGKTDSTLAIQRALNEGRDALCVTYLPAGTYLVSDTLEGISPMYESGGSALAMVFKRKDYGCILKGSSNPGARALIKLADNAPGFGDPDHPKPLIRFWAVMGTPPNVYEKSNTNFTQQIMDIDVDLSGRAGNSGAIGIDFLGCEGTAFQCSTINAEAAFAGIKHGLGSGGGMHDLTVLGGQYGAYLPVTQPTCSLSHATFKGQTVACVYNNSRGPLIMPGAVLEPAAGAAAVICSGGSRMPYNGGLALIDARIFMPPSSEQAAIQTDRSIYLSNVYVNNAATLVSMKDAGKAYEQTAKSDGWCHVKEYAANATVQYAEAQTVDGQSVRPDVIYIDGEKTESPVADIVQEGVTEESIPADLQSRHTWSGTFPWFDTSGILNAWDYGVTANGDTADYTDQWPALQKAIVEASKQNKALFLPRGIYRISKTLDLKANTKLVGASQTSTALVAITDPKINPNGDFLDSANPQPMIRTADDAKADTTLGLLRICVGMPTVDGSDVNKGRICTNYALRWQAGANSVIRNAFIRSGGPHSGGATSNDPVVVFSGNGGGRYYVAGITRSLIDGTSQPLRLYHYQVQPDGAQIRDASNIEIYGMKYEGVDPVITMKNSRNVRVFGEGGGGHPKSVFIVENSRDFLIANTHPQFGKVPLGERDFVLEDNKGTGDINQVVLYKRGNPTPEWKP